MSDRNIEPYDWFNKFFGNINSRRRGLFDTRDIFRDFEDMHKEMDRMFNVFTNISSNAPKELVREYQTPQGDNVREVGPIVYGYSMTIGPDGKPDVREFGNIKSFGRKGGGELNPQISSEREPLADVNSTENEVKVVLEMPGIKKEDIKIKAYDGAVEVIADNPQRRYYKTVELPKEADIETARSKYNNGILEVLFDKKKDVKPKGKEIKIE
ncbi:MAG: Hsp20/alpha crystallin family protein [Thermoproteota archaeon]|nr:Hsp20/alpha crystallin family protein [Thermoproteota archaeon]